MSPRIATLALLVAAGFATAAGAAELRPAVTVSGETVTLGDIFVRRGQRRPGRRRPGARAGRPRRDFGFPHFARRAAQWYRLAQRRRPHPHRHRAQRCGRTGRRCRRRHLVGHRGTVLRPSLFLHASGRFRERHGGHSGRRRRRADRQGRADLLQSPQRCLHRHSPRARERHAEPAPPRRGPCLSRDGRAGPHTRHAARRGRPPERYRTGCACLQIASARTSSLRSSISSACRRAVPRGRASPCGSPTCSPRSSSTRARRST